MYADPQKQKAANARWWKDHPERARAKAKRWYDRHHKSKGEPRPCYGWETVVTEGVRELVEHPVEQRWVRAMAGARVLGFSYAAIANQLTLLEVPTKRGGKWAAATVYMLLQHAALLRKKLRARER